ncbi:hypothetical protein GCM10009416_04100 [Craurococcus roseus]|uniref:Phage holin family protein n=1 Tax=Craurococcus roseus TaxID=77585 RepID=A0ABN1EM99_9PROT
MRLFRLLQLAAQAEMLRWKRTGRGYAIQAGLGAGAAVFGLMMLVMLHLAAMAWLTETSLGPVGAALVVAAVDLVLAGLFGFLAARGGLDPVAVEAERVRDNALRQVGDQTARAAVILPMLRSRSIKKGLFGTAATALLVGLIARRR